jgi:phage FluMu gp28-like protein
MTAAELLNPDLAPVPLRVVPYSSYLKYTRALAEMRDDWALKFPSFFLQRYAKTYDREAGMQMPLVLEPWQVALVDDTAGQSVVLKPRQTGFSFLRAGRSLAMSLLTPNYTGIFVSYNRDEAKNKIIYARALYESIIYRGKPRLTSDNMSELRFSNNSRIISFPAKAVRGYAEPDVFADEAAFIPGAAAIFGGTLSSGVRGGGTFTAGSTPYGEANFFAELYRNEGGRFPNFVRHAIQWWYSPVMCNDVSAALLEAPFMTTQDRVEKYGSEKLREIFTALSLDDFRREHECSFDAKDDTVITRARLLNACKQSETTDLPDLERTDCTVEIWQSPSSLHLEKSIMPAIRTAITLMHPTSLYSAGYDVARHGDSAALIILEERRDGRRVERGQFMFHDFDWHLQEQMLKGVAGDRQCRLLVIDSTGMGDKLAYDVRREFVREDVPWDEGKVIGVNFSNGGLRNQVFQGAVQAIEATDVLLYANEDLFRHFDVFKREPESGEFSEKYTLLRGRNKDGSKHHGDLVVALGLALWDYTVRRPQKRATVRPTGPKVLPPMPKSRIDFRRNPGGLWVPAVDTPVYTV